MYDQSSREAKQLTTSILDYFERYERLAMLRNDRSMLRHFQDCWCTVFTQFYGGCSLPRVPITRTLIRHADAAPAAKPQWQINKYARPMRKVVARESKRYSYGKRGGVFTQWYDVLECGHKIMSASGTEGDPLNKHRRCHDCQKQTSKGREMQHAS